MDQVKCQNKENKIIKELEKKGKFPDHYKEKVSMKKVSMDVMKPWIARRITELMGFEDEIVVEYCISQLENPPETGLDPKMLQISMTGFMERKAGAFCSELWKNLLSAQASPVGVPQEFLERKKQELEKKRHEADRVKEELARRRAELEAANEGAAPPRRHSRSRSPQGDRGGSSSPKPRRRRRFE